MPPEKPNRRLGRGLDALFGSPETKKPEELNALREISITQIAGNPFQPRKSFDPTELAELQESLRESGLLQPITVRTAPSGSGYELIAGERRLKAATALGWNQIPAVVKELSDQELLTLALVENLQRSDLNAIEEAEGYDQLIRRFGHTQQTVATMVGKDRSTVANTLRILLLPQSVKKLVESGQLSAGQVRPLLAITDEKLIDTLARSILEEGWSAREVERQVRELPSNTTAAQQPKRGRPKKTDTRSPELKKIEQMLRKHFQTDATITVKSGTRGSLSLEFYSAEDLERLLDIIGISDNPQ